MENHKFNRQMAQLVLLQRIELANPFIKRLRKYLVDICSQK